MSVEWTPLVDVPALIDLSGRADVRVVDCRFTLSAGGADAGAGERAWQAAHVPGAVYAHLERDLSGPSGAGLGRHPWPHADAFAATLARWGIDRGTRVVAYDDGDGAFASRLWWLLRCLGHAQVAVLDGGWAQWLARSGPVEHGGGAPDPVAPISDPAFDAACLLRDAEALQRHLDAGGLLLDARAAARFRGDVEPLDPRAGHVPGAVNRPYVDNLADGRFKPAAVLADEFDALLGGRPPSDLAVMCGSGVTACHHLLAMAHAGRPGARLFAPSWSGWVDDPARAVATGPG